MRVVNKDFSAMTVGTPCAAAVSVASKQESSLLHPFQIPIHCPRNPIRNRHDRDHWVDSTRRGKYARVRNIQTLRAPDLAPRINHTLALGRTHPTRSHLVSRRAGRISEHGTETPRFREPSCECRVLADDLIFVSGFAFWQQRGVLAHERLEALDPRPDFFGPGHVQDLAQGQHALECVCAVEGRRRVLDLQGAGRRVGVDAARVAVARDRDVGCEMSVTEGREFEVEAAAPRDGGEAGVRLSWSGQQGNAKLCRSMGIWDGVK